MRSIRIAHIFTHLPAINLFINENRKQVLHILCIKCATSLNYSVLNVNVIVVQCT